MRRLLTSALSLFLCLTVFAQDAPYPVFETDKTPPAELAARRRAVASKMEPGSIGVFFTNPEQVRNNDVDYLFRADSDFLYLTGFEEPDAALLLVPGGFDLDGQRVTEVLFCNVTTPRSLTWLGYRMGPGNAMRILGIQSVKPNDVFDTVLESAIKQTNARTVHTTSTIENPGRERGRMLAGYKRLTSDAKSQSLEPTLAGMREIKSSFEIGLIKKATDASVAGHIAALKAIKPGMREYEIGSLVSYTFARNGCEADGYPPIVGSGPNSTILHYNTNRRLMNAGEIVCMDAAGEYHGYSADVTRSFPVSGKFSPEQKAIYEIVLAACDAGIAECKPGASRNAVTQAINKVLAEGLTRLGIISDANGLRNYYMHGWGHGIGLDVHDPWPSSAFVPGMTFTVEPGIYIKEGSPCDKKWWNIGIRIEDDILITANGHENLSAKAPRTIAEVEATMAKR